MNADSPIVAEVRQRALEISARFYHDLEKYVAHLKEIERRYGDRVVNQVTVIRPASPSEPAKS